MVMSGVSLERVAGAMAHYLSSGQGEAAVAEVLNFEVKDLKLLRAPTEADLPVEPLRATLRYWQGLPKAEAVADVLKIEPEKLVGALGYLMLVDIGADTSEFRYALYGTRIAAVSGFDMTGKSVWDVATSSVMQTFFAACYRAVRETRCPLYSVHKAPPQITASHWHRLILPLGKAGAVKRFLVCNTPIQNGILV
jgi:hypothetical protein